VRDGALRSFWWLLERFCKDYKAMSKHRAAEELRRALVSLQRWVLQNMVIADSDLQSQVRLCELLTDCEAAATRAGIPLDEISGEPPAFGDRLRIPYTVGVTVADGKRVSAKVLQAGHAWSLRIRALVKVCDGVCNSDLEQVEQVKIKLPTNLSVVAALNAIEEFRARKPDERPNVSEICRKIAAKHGDNPESLRAQVNREMKKQKRRKS
jgi:hypothetical protein